ncbi:hypothetical protein [Leptospira mayottensis]|uniref:Uncharacterized protein n=2 Tax=Leptospira mayottensis TaxID=1137606 RepID=A0AA87MLD5_9LEPT|nr:hypothetical protein [Leptospira mayottensis]AXR64531.1 hypothetical protein DQM28_10160 [Leptospira mayottensis]EKR98450.1 hypothetical protein LEP1GSC125_1860 [Leptospira mayottensis 200901122]
MHHNVKGGAASISNIQTSSLDMLSAFEKTLISNVANTVKEQYPTFDWRRDDHSEMNDKQIVALYLVKNDISQICGNDKDSIQEFMSILEYIFDEEFSE